MAVSIPVHSGYEVKYGTGTGSNSDKINVWVEYKVTAQSVAGNTSTVKAYFYTALKPGEATGTYSSGGLNSSFSVGGKAGTGVSNGAYDFRDDDTRNLLGSYSGTITHNEDGTKNITIKGSFSTKSSYISGGSVSFSVTLPVIARLSTATLPAAGKMGQKIKISISRKSSDFTHNLAYTIGDAHKRFATGVGTSYEWEIPDLAALCDGKTSCNCEITCATYNGTTKLGNTYASFVLNVPDATTPEVSGDAFMGQSLTIKTPAKSSNFTHTLVYSFAGSAGGIGETYIYDKEPWVPSYDLAKLIPKDTDGKCTIFCTTYNGKNASSAAFVGETQIQFDLKVPDNEETKPTFSASIKPVHSVAEAFTSLYLQAVSSVDATFAEAASDYSEIASYKLVVGDLVKESSEPKITSDVINTYGPTAVRCVVTDARGYSREVPFDILVAAYAPPAITPAQGFNSPRCERCDSDGMPSVSGTEILLSAGQSYSPILQDGVQTNFCRLVYRLTDETAGTSVTGEVIPEGTAENTFSGKLSGVSVPTTVAYTLTLTATDSVGRSSSVELSIPTDAVTLHLRNGGKGVAVGQYSQRENSFEVSPDWDVYVYGQTLREYIRQIIAE